MAVDTDALVDILDLETIDRDLFRGLPRHTSLPRLFGGQVASQSLLAAGRTVEADRHVHSLHCYFLRPGRVDRSIVYAVERTREGRSFSTRRVVAQQDGRAIFTMSASFQVIEPGFVHQTPAPQAPDPESLPSREELLAADPSFVWPYDFTATNIDVRQVPVTSPDNFALVHGIPQPQVWFRALGELPDDPLIQACALTYASDLTLLVAALAGHGIGHSDPRLQIASLDHAMWFHQPFSAREWLLYDQSSPSAQNVRGLAEGHVFRRDGVMVASVFQEGLIRLHPEP